MVVWNGVWATHTYFPFPSTPTRLPFTAVWLSNLICIMLSYYGASCSSLFYFSHGVTLMSVMSMVWKLWHIDCSTSLAYCRHYGKKNRYVLTYGYLQGKLILTSHCLVMGTFPFPHAFLWGSSSIPMVVALIGWHEYCGVTNEPQMSCWELIIPFIHFSFPHGKIKG